MNDMTETINYGGALELSMNDFTDLPAAVIFFRNCNYNCFYCQNRDIITGCHVVPLSDVKKVIDRTKEFVSAVVFTGGEPTLQSKPLKDLAKYAKSCGLKVGLNTNGYRPDVLIDLLDLNLLDKVFIDIKASLLEPDRYRELIQLDLPHLTTNINKSACILVDSKIDVEMRTTVFEMFHTPKDVIEIMQYLNTIKECYNTEGTFTFKVQIGRKRNGDPCEKAFDIEKLRELIKRESFSFTEIIV